MPESPKLETPHWFASILSRPIAVGCLAIALLFAGGRAATLIPLEWNPTIHLPSISVSAYWADQSPRIVERYITAPIERALANIPGTASIESSSSVGSTYIRLEISEEADPATYAVLVSEKLRQLRGVLPDQVVPRLTRTVPKSMQDEQGFMTLQLIGNQSPDALRILADDEVASGLSSLSGIAEIEVQGGAKRELHIDLSAGRLATYNLTSNSITQSLREVLSDRAYGSLVGNGNSFLLMTSALDSVGIIENLPVSSDGKVKLHDIGAVSIQPALIKSISRIDGNPVVSLTLSRTPNSDMLSVSDAVKMRIEKIAKGLPAGVRLLVADDRTEDIRAEIADLRLRGGLGFLLVILVLVFQLKRFKSVAVVLLAVGTSLATAFLLMGPLGMTLNLITIGGLVLVFGLLVDNAVVVVEQIQKTKKRDAKTLAEALNAVWLPLLGGTLSTMGILIPLVYLSGELEALFLPFGVLVSVTLGASLLSAGILIPSLEKIIVYEPEVSRRRKSIVQKLSRFITRSPYRLAGRFPKTVFLILLVGLGLPFWMLPKTLAPEDDQVWSRPQMRLASVYNATLGTEWMQEQRKEWLDSALGGILYPFIDNLQLGESWGYNPRPEVGVRLGLPPGSPFETANELMSLFENKALTEAGVSRTILRVGQVNSSLRVQFTDEALSTGNALRVREKLIGIATRFAGVDISVYGIISEGGYYSHGANMGSQGMTIEARGPNYEDLEKLSEAFAERLRKGSRRVAGVDPNASNSWYSTKPRHTLKLDWSAEAVRRSGVTSQDLIASLNPMLASETPVAYIEGGASGQGQRRLPIRVTVDEAGEQDIRRLIRRPIITADSGYVQLAGITELSVREEPATIERIDQQYRRYIKLDYRGPQKLANRFLNKKLDEMPVPAGYALERTQYAFFTEDVQESFTWVILATLLLVFLITAAIFESWWLPLVVMLSLPLALVGLGIGFILSEANFAQGAFIGVVLLIGIAVNDSILLVDRFRQLKIRRPAVSNVILSRIAVKDRLRPMWTTTMTSVASMLPLLVFPDDAAFWLGLAVTVTGGLLASTLLSPLASVSMISLRKR